MAPTLWPLIVHTITVTSKFFKKGAIPSGMSLIFNDDVTSSRGCFQQQKKCCHWPFQNTGLCSICNQDNMSRYKTSFSPLLFLSFLHQRYVFRKPSFPEQLCHVLYPFPPFPSMKITLIKHSWWQNWFVLQQQQIIGCECFKIIESLQTLVKALSFNIASASQRTVWRPSSSKACFFDN